MFLSRNRGVLIPPRDRCLLKVDTGLVIDTLALWNALLVRIRMTVQYTIKTT